MKVDLHGLPHEHALEKIVTVIEHNLHHEVILTFVTGNSMRMKEIVMDVAINYGLQYNNLVSTEMTVRTDGRKVNGNN